MKTKIIPVPLILFAWCVATSLWAGCSLVREQTTSPAGTSNAPPITTELQTVAQVAPVVIPAPWGNIIASALGVAGAAFAAYAAKHANAASANSAASAASAAVSAAVSTPAVPAAQAAPQTPTKT